jgi:hypothetical protein
MSNYIKNDEEWCKLHPDQPTFEEIEQEVRAAGRPWHPLLRGLKRTKCGSLIGGRPVPQPVDGSPVCSDCDSSD